MFKLLAVVLVLVVVLRCLLGRIRWRPHGYRVPLLQRLRPTKDFRSRRFRWKRTPEKQYDHIVLGAGISGLACGAALAKNGKRVLVLEKHDVAGGSIHVFSGHGVEFDTGFHYVGDVHKHLKLLDFLGVTPMTWRKLGTPEDGHIYDRFHIRDRIYDARAGEQALIDDLTRDFPDEALGIRQYVQAVKRYAQQDLVFESKLVPWPWVRQLLDRYVLRSFYQQSRISAYDWVSQFTSNEDLREVLCALSIDGGPPPSIQSSFMHASIVNHFLEGAYYPVGGAATLPNSLIPTIEMHGGDVFTQAHVSQIVIENRQVVGVMVNDVFIPCRSVISSLGIPATFDSDLIAPQWQASLPYEDLLERVPCSVTYFFTYVVLDGTDDELGLRSSNDWIWQEGRFEESIQRFNQSPYSAKPITFIASNSAKDPSWSTRYPGKSVVAVISWSQKELFDGMDHGTSGHRTEEMYGKCKRFFEKINLETLAKIYPKTQGKILTHFSATPSTLKHYIGSYACYGLDATTERFATDHGMGHDCLRPQTDISGLWLTGQDLTSLGVTGAFMSGILTANAVEGYGGWTDIVLGAVGIRRDLLTDLGWY